MSPAPLENFVDAEARVHTPLTLSDTWTCPAESYWPAQPTSRSPAATGLASWNVALATFEPVPKVPPCTHFALGGGPAGVVTASGDDWAEWLPAASKASTVEEQLGE